MGATISTITISPETYEQLTKAIGHVADLRDEVWNLEFELQKEREKSKEAINHLSNMLDEFEGMFDNDEQFESHEFGEDYIKAAKFMVDNDGRIENRIRQVEDWMTDLPY